MVALLVWGAARYQLLSLDVNVRRAAAALGAALAPFLVVPLAAPLAADGTTSGAVVIALVAATVAVPAAFTARGLATDGRGPTGSDRRYLLYATALTSGEDDAALVRLRRRLGIAEDEHHRLRAAVAQEAMITVSEARPNDVVLGAYRIERALGETAKGPTLLAHDVLLDRPVVLKPLGALPTDPGARERVLREGRIAARLRHPRVVEVYKVERDREELYLVTEFAPGGDVGALLARERVLPPARAQRTVEGCCIGPPSPA
jgi:hypothetical protein